MSAMRVVTSGDTSALPRVKDGESIRAATGGKLAAKKKVVTIVTPTPEGFRALQGVKINPWKPDMSKCKVCGKSILSTTVVV